MDFAKIFSIFALLMAALMVTSLASPVSEQQEVEPKHYDELELYGRTDGDHLVRLKRASCDLFSFSSKWGTPNHAVCAAHCIALGKRGGECKGTVCHCRA
uniref:Defensin n=1 Tax=Lygus hesperus TaxID=30085 RepID=A0A146LC17_LYGHE